MNPRGTDLPEAAGQKYAAIALARYLLCFGPTGPEWDWQSDQAMNQAPGQWFAFRKGQRTTYLRSGESGRFSVTPPEGVDPATLPVIDESGSPPTLLRDYLDALVKSIATTDPAAAMRIDGIAQAARKADDLGVLRSEIFAICDVFIRREPNLPDLTYASEFEKKTHRRFIDLEIPGTLVSSIFLLTRIVSVAMPVDFVHQAFGIGGCLDIFDGPQVFVRDVLAKIIQIEGGEAQIAAAAAALQVEAELLADRAEAASDFGVFYGTVFESFPYAYAAQQGFELLANTSIDKSKRGNYKMLANVCEERVVAVFATMSVDFSNALDWRELHLHRAAVARARESGGSAAAEQLADQYTKFALLYPLFIRDFLLSKTDKLSYQA
jgi:hypothetical protein